MSGVQIKFNLNDKAVQRAVREQLKRTGGLDKFLKGIADDLELSIDRRFRKETGPDGKRWQALSPVTISARQKKHGNAPMKILQEEGNLKGFIAHQVSGGTLRIGTGKDAEAYAAIQQFGGKAGKDRKVIIPARPYLGFSDQDAEMIEEEAQAYFFGSWRD